MSHQTYLGLRKRGGGFSLVEIMVALVVGLLGTIVIFQVFAVSEGYKRTTTGGSDAQQNGGSALFEIERDLRRAGYGVNQSLFLGCAIQYWDELNPGVNPALVLAPVNIDQGASGAPDSITVLFGNSDLLPTPAKFTQNMPSASADFKVDNRFGFREGDLIVAAEAGKDCTLAQVSNLPATGNQTLNVIHNSGNYTDPITNEQEPTRYNKPGGLSITYTTAGQLFNIGSLPTDNVYSVSVPNSQLMSRAVLTNSANAAIVDGIVQMQAQYGKDDGASGGTANDGIVDSWDEIDPTTPATWSQVLAVRLALVARSGLRERPDAATGLCNITTTMPAWIGGTITLTNDGDGTSWQCYRYRTYETVAPIRNMIWKPE
ncbi:MAG: PilW family protein [Burkholderiales bacterium]|nr:PilW family protein [Burkholderiales bacterium]